jgi:multicomponent Na+:H+ antiporter subunit E
VTLAVVLFAVWMLWSGHTEPLIVGFGVASCIAVPALLARLRVLDDESVPLRHALPGLRYAPWILWEIVKANLDVARRIVDPRLPISPRVIRVRMSQRTELGRVVYANSITLTPGTISMELEGDEIVVHALTREAAEGLAEGAMDRRVCRFEGRE